MANLFGDTYSIKLQQVVKDLPARINKKSYHSVAEWGTPGNGVLSHAYDYEDVIRYFP